MRIDRMLVPLLAAADRARRDACAAAAEKKAKKPAAKSAGEAALRKAFVGSEACGKCHAEELESWKESFHSKMVRPREQGILKDVVAKWKGEEGNAGPTTGNGDGKSYALEDVKYVIGSKWKQRFLVANPDTGGLQFLNRQFNRNSGKWENYGQKNDWNTMCATCHTTGYRITAYDAANPKAQKVEFAELGVGCEACHGPGAKHVQSKKKADIFNVANRPIPEQSRLCGYCHQRLENEQWKSAQGNPREDLPAPKLGETFRAGEDWTKWYPEHAIMPGIQAEDPIDKSYAGDLKDLFKVDDVSKADGVFEEAKHHQEYQGFLQSTHYKKGEMSCITCHSPHAGKGKLKKVAADACKACHDASFTVEKYMPNTGKTADNLFVKSHTFKKNPRPSSGPGATGTPDYYQ